VLGHTGQGFGGVLALWFGRRFIQPAIDDLQLPIAQRFGGRRWHAVNALAVDQATKDVGWAHAERGVKERAPFAAEGRIHVPATDVTVVLKVAGLGGKTFLGQRIAVQLAAGAVAANAAGNEDRSHVYGKPRFGRDWFFATTEEDRGESQTQESKRRLAHRLAD
jgi:hypothetical protein